jgi:hypothetical protein
MVATNVLAHATPDRHKRGHESTPGAPLSVSGRTQPGVCQGSPHRGVATPEGRRSPSCKGLRAVDPPLSGSPEVA